MNCGVCYPDCRRISAGSTLPDFAPQVRNHERFAPRGVNVNVIYHENGGNLFLRTYERGVEGETGACGTGALSAAIAAVLRELPVRL